MPRQISPLEGDYKKVSVRLSKTIWDKLQEYRKQRLQATGFTPTIQQSIIELINNGVECDHNLI